MRRLLALGLVTAPLVTGTIVMWLGGAPAARWGGHLAAGAIGLCIYAAVARAPHNQAAPEFALARRGLTVYFATAAVVSAFGQFPVPLLGFGASSVLGAFLGLAVLRRAAVS